MSEAKTAVQWSEVVWFVECSHCGELHTLGEAECRDGAEMDCEKCGQTFIVVDKP